MEDKVRNVRVKMKNGTPDNSKFPKSDDNELNKYKYTNEKSETINEIIRYFVSCTVLLLLVVILVTVFLLLFKERYLLLGCIVLPFFCCICIMYIILYSKKVGLHKHQNHDLSITEINDTCERENRESEYLNKVTNHFRINDFIDLLNELKAKCVQQNSEVTKYEITLVDQQAIDNRQLQTENNEIKMVNQQLEELKINLEVDKQQLMKMNDDMKHIMQQLGIENTKLKEEKERLQKENDEIEASHMKTRWDIANDNMKFREENSKLRQDIKKHEGKTVDLISKITEIEYNTQKKKMENKNLSQELAMNTKDDHKQNSFIDSKKEGETIYAFLEQNDSKIENETNELEGIIIQSYNEWLRNCKSENRTLPLPDNMEYIFLDSGAVRKSSESDSFLIGQKAGENNWYILPARGADLRLLSLFYDKPEGNTYLNQKTTLCHFQNGYVKKGKCKYSSDDIETYGLHQ